MSRWMAEVQNHYVETPDGLDLRYDPKLRDAVLEAGAQPALDLWPLYDAMHELPLRSIRVVWQRPAMGRGYLSLLLKRGQKA